MNDKTRYTVENADGTEEHHTDREDIALWVATELADTTGKAHIIDRHKDGTVRGYVLTPNT